ncbi:hypothetical protein, partial [Phormidium sp. CCY1219]|uniref:hypothetical protein n=1 Tax=Phormidium sp. CCY1219 TaxID=2886104 RepID=UPI002D1F1FAE
SGEEPTDGSGEEPTDGSGEEPTDGSGETSTSPLFDAQYVIEQNQDALQEQFPDFDFENLTEEQVAQVEDYVSQEGLQPSPSVNLSYFNSVVKERVSSALQEEGLTQEEIANLSQKELLQKAVELGYSPTPLVQFDYFKSVHSEELTELASEKGIDLASLSNEELLKFITSEGVAEGLNPSAFFNFEFVKKQHKEKIREAVDIADGEEGVAELEPEKVLDNVFDSGEYYIDVRFVREQYSQQLIEFYGVTSVEELSDEQVEAYAFSEEAEAADVSMSPLNLEGFAAQYTAELTAFYSVESVEELSEYELYRFMATEAVEQGLDVTEYVEVSYYQSTFEAAMVATFGVASIEEVSAEQTVEFVFGDAAPYVDAEFFKLKYGEETTADGTLVKELSGEELKYYIFSAGWEAGFTNLSAFDIETFTTQYSAQVVEFYSASSIEEVSEAEIVDYMVGEAWKVGVDLSEFVTAEDVEVYRSEHEAGLAEYYGITVEEVTELSAEIVVDFAFGGVSEAVDFDYARFALGEEMVTYFTEQGETVTDASELSKLQVVEYLYAQDSLEAVKLSAFDVKGFVDANTDAIAEAFGVEAEEVAEIDREKLEKFMLGEGVQLGLSLSGYVELDYIRETYTEAIAGSLEVSVDEVANLDDASLLEWVGSELSTIDVNYVGYQFEQLSETQQTDLLTNLEIDVDLTAGQVLTADQLVKIAYSEEFKAALEVEEVKLSAIDVSGYIADNADALSAFYGEAGIKVNSGSNKLKSGSLNFKSGNVAKSGSMKFNSSSMKLSGDSSMKLKSGSLKFKSGKISGDAEFDVSNLTDKQVVKFMFDTGWEQGINPLNYVEVEYLKSEFAVDIARYYDIEVSAVGELNEGLVLDYMYGGLSNDIDYSFVRSTYESELTAEFGVSSVEEVSDLQVLEYVYAQGPANVELSAVDVKGFVEQYGEQIAEQFGVDLSTAPEVSEFEIKSFMFNQASEQLGIDVSEFVNFEYYSANFSQQIVSNYRVENVFNLQSDMVYDFMSGEGISEGLATSPAIDLTWYRETYADILTQELETIDGDGNGEISDGELYDYAVGTGLENGQETSDSYDLESYFADDAVVDDLLNYSGATSIEEVSNLEKVEYIFGQGLSDGHSPDGLGLDAIKNDPANQDGLLQFASATSIEEVSMYQVYNYASSEGLLV